MFLSVFCVFVIKWTGQIGFEFRVSQCKFTCPWQKNEWNSFCGLFHSIFLNNDRVGRKLAFRQWKQSSNLSSHQSSDFFIISERVDDSSVDKKNAKETCHGLIQALWMKQGRRNCHKAQRLKRTELVQNYKRILLSWFAV